MNTNALNNISGASKARVNGARITSLDRLYADGFDAAPEIAAGRAGKLVKGGDRKSPFGLQPHFAHWYAQAWSA
jgi:hypothetical protein